MDRYNIVFNRFQGYTTINTVRSYCSCTLNSEVCNCAASKNSIISSLDAWLARFFDEYLIWHHSGTAELCSWIALELGLSSQDRRTLIQSTLLHDIGKLFVPHTILVEKGVLSDKEMTVVRNHAAIGSDFLLSIGFSDDIVLAAKYHHERFNGTGYPDGLIGHDIPLYSRIISVADTLDAMLSGRHYHNSKYNQIEIAKALENGAGTQYDPQIAEIAVEYILKKEKMYV